MKIGLNKLYSGEGFKFIKIGTQYVINKVWVIIFNSSNKELEKLISEHWNIFLRKHGADCYLLIEDSCKINNSEIYFSNHKTALKAVEKLEALMVMNKLME